MKLNDQTTTPGPCPALPELSRPALGTADDSVVYQVRVSPEDRSDRAEVLDCPECGWYAICADCLVAGKTRPQRAADPLADLRDVDGLLPSESLAVIDSLLADGLTATGRIPSSPAIQNIPILDSSRTSEPAKPFIPFPFCHE